MAKAENCNKEYIVHKSGVCMCVCVFLSDFANHYVRPLFLNIRFTGSGVWVTCEFVGNTELLTTPDLLTQSLPYNKIPR